MGHLLGAAPAHPGACAVIDISPPFIVREAEVRAVQRPDQPPAGVAAFAIDSPGAGDRSIGAGIEVNGWVIGQDAPARGVRTVNRGRPGAISPLDVRRPDVAADYPAFPHARSSGFTAWAPIAGGASEWRTTIEAVLADGSVATLAEIAGSALISRRCDWPAGMAPVTAPDFVIIGAQRGGTTSLHAYLSAHPEIRTPLTKELHFLTDRYERGRDWYLDQFPFALPSGTLTGEATPYALFHPLAPQRLRAIAPDARLLVLLRDPVDRAWSHYLLERSRGDEPLDFPAALEAEADRLAGEEERLISDAAYVSAAHKHFSYQARGEYDRQLTRWFNAFPREQFLILRSKDLYERTAEAFRRVTTFLGIDPAAPVPFARHNQSAGPPLDPALRRRLRERFEPSNARLTALLGWDPGWR